MAALLTDDVCGKRAMATGNANAKDKVVTMALNGRCKRGLRRNSCVLSHQLVTHTFKQLLQHVDARN